MSGVGKSNINRHTTAGASAATSAAGSSLPSSSNSSSVRESMRDRMDRDSSIRDPFFKDMTLGGSTFGRMGDLNADEWFAQARRGFDDGYGLGARSKMGHSANMGHNNQGSDRWSERSSGVRGGPTGMVNSGGNNGMEHFGMRGGLNMGRPSPFQSHGGFGGFGGFGGILGRTSHKNVPQIIQ